MAVFNKDEINELDLTQNDVEEKEHKLPSFEELVQQINGRDALGKAYATAYISIYYKDFDHLDEEFEPIEELSFVGPVFTLFPVSDPAGEHFFIRTDIEFGTENIKDIVALHKLLEKFEALKSEIKEDNRILPVFSMLLKPNKKLENDERNILYFMDLMMPFYWAVTSDYPGRASNRISMLFEGEYCNILRNLISQDATREIINQEQIKARARVEEEHRQQEEEAKKIDDFAAEIQERIHGNMMHPERDVSVVRVGRDADKNHE